MKNIALYKTLTWRVIATTVTASLVLLWTGSLPAAGAIGLVDGLIKLVLYYLHEKAYGKYTKT